jgi:hypothetical protein
MQNERCKLMAMLASPDVTSAGIWRWFLTITPNDIYDSRLYEILAAEQDVLWDSCYRALQAKVMGKEDRKKLLTDHPALAARLFDIKLKCIFDCILLGKDKPLGEIVDFFKRIEFQLRGSPHAHCLICVKRNMDNISEAFVNGTTEEKQQVINLIKNIVTAVLENPPDGTDTDTVEEVT